MNGDYLSNTKRLNSAASYYKLYKMLFDGVCDAAIRFNDQKAADVKGIEAKVVDADLVLKFLDRQLRVTLACDYKSHHAELVVTDYSITQSDPELVERIRFQSDGKTNLPGGQLGDNMNLNLHPDCISLVTAIVAQALDFTPNPQRLTRKLPTARGVKEVKPARG